MSLTAPITREAGNDQPQGAAIPAAALLVAVGLILFGIRLAGPPNLLDNDQERPAAYVLDAVRNGQWICQRDWFADITSKPPLYTWLCAIPTLASGRINLFSLYVPGALATIGSACLLLCFGHRYFGTRAALFGALALFLTPTTVKAFALARTDAVFAFTVTAAALMAFRAWQSGRGWIWFWLLAAAATLTKGPLGVILGMGGLFAVVWERRTGNALPLRGSHWPGVLVFFLLTGGWFALAYSQFGDPLVAKMIGKELVGHALPGASRGFPGSHFYQPPLYYLARSLPASLLAYYGFWQIWKHPALNTEERRFERFLFCWFATGLLIFSLAPHQRADLIWPIIPAGALLAGRELDRFTRRWQPHRVTVASTTTVIMALLAFALYYFMVYPRQRMVQQTIAVRNLAHDLERVAGREFPLTHIDSPFGLQVYLNTLWPRVSAARAAQLLRGREAAYVAVKDLSKLQSERLPDDPPLYTLLPAEPASSNSPVFLVGNRPSFTRNEPIAFCLGPLAVQMQNAWLRRATENELWFEPSRGQAVVSLTNESPNPRRIVVAVPSQPGRLHHQQRTLAPHESWQLTLP